jgi:hypothetical protein
VTAPLGTTLTCGFCGARFGVNVFNAFHLKKSPPPRLDPKCQKCRTAGNTGNRTRVENVRLRRALDLAARRIAKGRP